MSNKKKNDNDNNSDNVREEAEGSIKELWTIAFPIIISMASFTVMQFVSRIFLSWYDTDAIAAAVPSGILTFNIISFFSGIISFCNVLVAQYYGSNQYKNVTRTLWTGIYFSLISAFLILFFIPLGISIINLSSHSLSVKAMEIDYFATSAKFGGVAILNGALSAFFIGIGRTKIPMIVNLIGNLFNILLSFVFIFGLKVVVKSIPIITIPEMGIKGAAWAMVLANFIMVIIFCYFAFCKKEFKERYKTTSDISFSPKIFKKILRYGVPSGIALILEITSFTAFVFLIGNVNTVALAANNIVLSMEMIAFMPMLGLGIATSALVGQYIGRKKFDVAKKIPYKALKLAMLYCGSLGLLFIFTPDLFINLFLASSTGVVSASHSGPHGMTSLNAVEIATMSKILMKILAAFIICDSIGSMFGNAIKGGGDTRFYMLAFTMMAWLVFVPGIYIILNVLKLPITYAWGWSVVHLSCLAIIFYLRFKSEKWLHHKILEL
ncbi:MAG: MATE family efflux transporter [Oligoflexia bacterium]|nr:MATE family efflux transporter [Oligoflexia bacterium]